MEDEKYQRIASSISSQNAGRVIPELSEFAFDDSRIITTSLHIIYGLKRHIDGQNGKMIQ